MMKYQSLRCKDKFHNLVVVLGWLFFLSSCYPVEDRKEPHAKSSDSGDSSMATEPSPDSALTLNYYTEIGGNRIYTEVDEPPMFPDIHTFLRKNLIYPVDALDKSLEETIMVSFVVGRDGRLRSIKAISQTHKSLNNEAVRLVSLMQDWSPGMENGEPVDVRCILPIRFSLDKLKTVSR